VAKWKRPLMDRCSDRHEDSLLVCFARIIASAASLRQESRRAALYKTLHRKAERKHTPFRIVK
jgi:hypothetical protein